MNQSPDHSPDQSPDHSPDQSPAEPAAPEALRFGPDDVIPNNPELPALVYRGAVPADAAAIEALFAGHGWSPQWRWGVYDFDHYHDTGHEALGCFAGSGRLRLGGPEGVEVAMAAGDVVVLPAGTGHGCVSASDDFRVVGAYPPGQTGAILTAPATAETRARIAAVPRPGSDPVAGPDGPLIRLWRAGG